MNSSLIVTILVTLLPLSLLGNEPSAFGAGNINNPKPYGLTANEEVLLENKKTIHKVVVKSNNQENKVDSLRERIDGLQSVVESLSRKAQTNTIQLKKLDKKNQDELMSADEYDKRLSEVTQSNTINIEKLKLVISELSVLIDTINSSYVSKDEFNALVVDVNKFKDLVAKELKNTTKSTKSTLNKMNNAEIFRDAKAFFNKKYYTKAIEYYSYLIEKNYKPATSHYMIGEMNYRRKVYSEAIAYFKKSASLYSKASYMPKLMLHTAISMKRTGDTKNAKVFFNALVRKYPKSQEAVEAKKILKVIK